MGTEKAEILTLDDAEETTVEQYEELLDFLDPLSIGLRLGSSVEHQDQYGAVAHSKLLRLKMLGLSDANCAKAAGINRKTLAKWQDRYPMLVADMERAEQLAVVGAARRLFALMGDNGPVGLNAVKFFLGTHADEFREKTELHLRAEPNLAELAEVIRNVYGVQMPESGESSDPGSGDAPPGLPAPGD